jgi:hypothetical protein
MQENQNLRLLFLAKQMPGHRMKEWVSVTNQVQREELAKQAMNFLAK